MEEKPNYSLNLQMRTISEVVARCEKHRTITRRDSATKIYGCVSRQKGQKYGECNSEKRRLCIFTYSPHYSLISVVDYEESRQPHLEISTTVYKRQITQKRRHFDKSSSKNIWPVADSKKKFFLKIKK